ncbi:type II toxin-antitoxin system SpoIISA family toxin [Bacillus sp. NPDC077027]|uniref:type II toxin-antitoxin system SpoIISA family toxin n=1 Tax=Bacillus sp. NPDC077027 TaxID=3390548 RepID=UPI003D056594
MLLFFQFTVWFLLFALAVYVYAVWRFEQKVKEKMFAIRKTWYLIYVVGAVVYWTQYPESIFTDWMHYLIIAIFFALTDAFIFLSSYIKKLGHHELETDTHELLEENNDLLHSYLNKLKTYQYLLKNEPIHVYYGSIEAYVEGIERLIRTFAEKMNIQAVLCQYGTQEQKDDLLRTLEQPFSIQAKLERQEVFYDDFGKLVLIPFSVSDVHFVIKLTSDDIVTEFDYLLITSLTSIYDLILPDEEEGE